MQRSKWVEYRVPSNFYMVSNKLKEWAYYTVVNAFKYINEKGFLEDSLASYVRETINNNNKAQATELVKTFNLQLA